MDGTYIKKSRSEIVEETQQLYSPLEERVVAINSTTILGVLLDIRELLINAEKRELNINN